MDNEDIIEQERKAIEDIKAILREFAREMDEDDEEN